ncbi:Acetyltransferase (GNAT) domain-containing protein [Catalinimonas alkaloidigena]|uniref:Acetyltransferase (GNAT) domain-containing protein n=1 Tax=Catalinimonas alkaloidigena TaxID=1075417 RepID=A0A1G9GUI6_9BACT|nr:GNAT family N-acetyltransferase [Catalinimonas alkaloidigena]SDL04380.1 Acetyltransferase (GNAT) domain-containing protein [Catalinimonas alkaloidigena]
MLRLQDLYLFNRPEFIAFQALPALHTLRLHQPRTDQVEALWHMAIHDQVGYSPWRATFGGPQFVATLPPPRLAELLQQGDALARHEKLRALVIRTFPAFYDPAGHALLTHALLQHGYALEATDLTYFLALRRDGFEKGLHTTGRKKLRRAERHGFTFHEEEPAFAPEAYQIIAATRQRKGYPVTLSEESLLAHLRALPDYYRLFSVRRSGRTAAVGLVVVISPSILYTFYVGDVEEFRTHSPAVMLYQGIYYWGVTKGYRLLDFGIGTDQTEPNEGLMQFKRMLGGEPSLKFTFRKDFHPDL